MGSNLSRLGRFLGLGLLAVVVFEFIAQRDADYCASTNPLTISKTDRTRGSLRYV
jgi:hypothetical protein